MRRDLGTRWIVTHSNRHLAKPELVALRKAKESPALPADVGYLRGPDHHSIFAHLDPSDAPRSRARLPHRAHGCERVAAVMAFGGR